MPVLLRDLPHELVPVALPGQILLGQVAELLLQLGLELVDALRELQLGLLIQLSPPPRAPRIRSVDPWLRPRCRTELRCP